MSRLVCYLHYTTLIPKRVIETLAAVKGACGKTILSGFLFMRSHFAEKFI